MSDHNTKKQYEKFLLERFLDAAKLPGQVVDDKGESPDFIAEIQGERVGIEITELFNTGGKQAGASQAREAHEDKIVADARNLYTESEGQFAHVSVLFAPNLDYCKLDRTETSCALAAMAMDQALKRGQPICLNRNNASDKLPQAVTHVQMYGVSTKELGHWRVARAGWVGPLTVEILQDGISRKASRLPVYKKRADTNWLVLVTNSSKPSQFFEESQSAIDFQVSSPFARTFYFGLVTGTVRELSLAPV